MVGLAQFVLILIPLAFQEGSAADISQEVHGRPPPPSGPGRWVLVVEEEPEREVQTSLLQQQEISTAKKLRIQSSGKAVSVKTAKTDGSAQPATWFDSFTEDESTFNIDGEDLKHQSGWEPIMDNPYKGKIQNAAFFHESNSGGAQEAWQTHYPAAKGIAARGHSNGHWHQTGDGQWTQDYMGSDHDGHDNLHAGLDPTWFDSSVDQVDGYGRAKYPSTKSGKRYTWFQERSVNTTIKCKDPGCTATTSLLAFDPKTEEAHNCKLNLHVHPTDFDDSYSREGVEWIEVNGRTVNTECYPMASGCDAKSQKPLHPCILELPLDLSILNSTTGTLDIKAKISATVDECPYDGNLLAGVPVVTCLVATKEATEIEVGAPRHPVPVAAQAAKSLFERIPLQCPERGCKAFGDFKFNSSEVKTCQMSIKVNQTDFDGDHDTGEKIEYVKLNGEDVKMATMSGKNPCKFKWTKGQELPAKAKEITLVEKHDVTEQVKTAMGFSLEAKISDLVDECASQGYLLDGYAEVECALEMPSTSKKHSSADKATGTKSLIEKQDGATQLVAKPRVGASLLMQMASGPVQKMVAGHSRSLGRRARWHEA